MSDDIYKPDADDEYQFNDNENAVVYKAAAKKPKNALFANRRLWLTIAAIIVIMLLYRLYGLYKSGSHDMPVKVVSGPIIEPTVTAPQPKVVSDTPQVVVTPAPSVPIVPENSLKFKALEENLVALKRENEAVHSQLSQVQNDVRAMVNQMADLQQQLAKLNAPAVVKSMVPPKKAAVPKPIRPNYFVQAVLPGRAWLVKAEDNTTLTVVVGDELPGYGKVININPIQASVMTSSDYTITYKPE